VEWAETDAKGGAVNDGCLDCVTVIVDGFVMLWAVAVDKCHTKQEKEFRAAFKAALRVRCGQDEAVFKPPSSVGLAKEQGHMLFYDVGYLTEAELVNITDLPAKALKITMSSLVIEDSLTEVKGAFVSLKGITETELAGLRRVRIFRTVFANHGEIILDPSNQLRQLQGSDTFSYIADQEMSLREPGIKPSSRAFLPTLAALREKAKAIIAAREAKEAKEATDDGCPPLLPNSGSEEEEDEGEVKRRAAPSLAIGSLAVAKAAWNQKAQAKKKTSRGGKGGKRSPTPEADGSLKSGLGRGESFHANTSVGAAANLDPEMLKVAIKLGASYDCLENLSVDRMLSGEKLGRSIEAVAWMKLDMLVFH
jgi:hypothetical protein